MTLKMFVWVYIYIYILYIISPAITDCINNKYKIFIFKQNNNNNFTSSPSASEFTRKLINTRRCNHRYLYTEVIRDTLVKCFFNFLHIDALLVVGSIMLGQNSEERTQLQPPFVCGNATVPVCLAFELCHGLEPAKVAS